MGKDVKNDLVISAEQAQANPQLYVSKILGEPIDTNLPRPMVIDLIANHDTVNPGEDLYKWTSLNTDADEVKTIDGNGVITASKVTLEGKTSVSFTGLDTKKLYILIDELVGSPNQTAFTDKRNKLIRGLDKIEVRLMLKLITDDADVVTITPASGEDLFDVIVRGKHNLEDYGDKYELLAGSAVKEGIDLYNKKKADDYNYNVDLPGSLVKLGINVTKIFGYVKYTGDMSKQRLLDTNKFILVATDSTISKTGKPLYFIRRKISPAIAKLMNADVNKAQRALFVDPAPTQVANEERMGVGVFAYESIAIVNCNFKSIIKSSDLSSILGVNL